MKLNKEQAIHEHRKMWRWLAEFYAAIDRWHKKSMSIVDAKEIYLFFKKYEDICSDCFCCEYVAQADIHCRECPVVWHNKLGVNADHCCDGEFGIIFDLSDAKAISKMCRIISELPERKDI